MDMYDVIRTRPLLGILRNVPLNRTLDWAEAAITGGADYFEVALNSPDALRQITLLRTHFGDRCLVGAGTAITTERCRSAVDAGAQFLLTPGTPVEVYEFCQKENVRLLPGVLTPTDVALALSYGCKTMKLFPAGSMPARYIKDLQGPFDGTQYMAIGGVNPDNITEFFKNGYCAVGLASSLMPRDRANAGDWQACADYVRGLVEKIRAVQG